MAEFTEINKNIDAERTQEVEPASAINIENIGYQSLSVDKNEISNIMKSWGFSNKEINEFKITFRPAIVDNPKFHKMLAQGFYQKQSDGSGLIEIYTTLPVKTENDENYGVAIKESVLQWVLAHEMRHAMQDRVGELENHPVSEADEDYDGNVLEQDAEAYAKDNIQKFKNILSCTDAPKNPGEIGAKEIAEEDQETQDGLDIEKTYLMNKSDHPAKTWEGDMEQVYEALINGEVDLDIARENWTELLSRGKNMAESGALGRYELELKEYDIAEKVEDYTMKLEIKKYDTERLPIQHVDVDGVGSFIPTWADFDQDDSGENVYLYRGLDNPGHEGESLYMPRGNNRNNMASDKTPREIASFDSSFRGSSLAMTLHTTREKKIAHDFVNNNGTFISYKIPKVWILKNRDKIFAGNLGESEIDFVGGLPKEFIDNTERYRKTIIDDGSPDSIDINTDAVIAPQSENNTDKQDQSRIGTDDLII